MIAFDSWVFKLKSYHEFLQWYEDEEESPPDYENMTEDEAKSQLWEDLEFIVATNGYNELFETEKEYMKELGMTEYV